MKKYLQRVEAAISEKNFPLWVFAAVGLIWMPQHWGLYVFSLVGFSLFYRYVKTNPGCLKDRHLLSRPEVQRTAVLALSGFVLYLLGNVFRLNEFDAPNAFSFGMLSLTVAPLLVYGTTAFNALRAWPKGISGSKKIEDLRKIQKWTNSTFTGFLTAFVFTMAAIAWWPLGIGTWLYGWLSASLHDANLLHATAKVITAVDKHGHGNLYTMAPAADLHLCNAALAICLIVFFWPQAVRLSAFLTSWFRRIDGRFSSGIQDTFVRTLHAPTTVLALKAKNSFAKNVGASLAWLVACYLMLFGLIGFSGGPVGNAINGWLKSCLADARIIKGPQVITKSFPESPYAKKYKLAKTHWPKLAFDGRPQYKPSEQIYASYLNGDGTISPEMRVFCAAIFALYGTVPFAVTGAILLPYARRRRIILNADGVFFPDGPFLTVGLRALRLWSDFSMVDLRRFGKSKNPKKGQLVISFHSGGKVKLDLSQLKDADLEKLLAVIDENALECKVSEDVLSLRTQLRGELRTCGELGGISSSQFQSTIFVPHQPGTWLPDGETRVVRLLATRPLACVYLVRTDGGKLAIAKQFFLADENDETNAMRKCFHREYELLGKIDHPAISKVLNVFDRDQSIYLLIEHADGVDLRTLVSQQGALSEEKVIEYAIQICDVMTYLHLQDPPIVHRDLTPDNLVLADDGTIRVIDFGAAHQFMEGITGTVIGKQCYISPEQLQGHAGARSDIYSMGGVMHFLLTGEEPMALTKCDPAKKADVTPELNGLIMSCTDFDENLRPESFAKLKEMLITAADLPVRQVIEKMREVVLSQVGPNSVMHQVFVAVPEVDAVAAETLTEHEKSATVEEANVVVADRDSETESDGVTISTKQLEEQPG